MPKVTRPVEPECLLGRSFFSTCPSDGARSQLAAPAWGTCRGGENPPRLLRGQRPALWNTAVGQTQSFHPTWWRGEGGDSCRPVSLYGALRVSQTPLPGFKCVASYFPQKPEVADPISPIFYMSKPKLPKAGTCSRSHIRTLDSKSPIGQGIGASQPPASPFQVSGHSPRGPPPRHTHSPTPALIPQGTSEQRLKDVRKQSTQRTG